MGAEKLNHSNLMSMSDRMRVHPRYNGSNKH